MNDEVLSIRLNVLLVGEDGNGCDWADVRQEYRRLTSYPLGQFVETAPFSISTAPKAGAHLHWILPGKLTTGIQEEAGTVRYPLVPNRWLVTRVQNPQDQTPICRRWLVASDALTSPTVGQGTTGSRSYPFLQDSITPYRYLGSVTPADTAPPVPSTVEEALGLTAVLPGDPLFAAYYPNCRNVFGMYDDLSDIPPNTALAYLVCGWYEGKTQGVPRCQGSALGLFWQGPGALYPSGVPKGDFQLALGESSSEVMAAQAGNPLLEPLMDGLLHHFYSLSGEREANYNLRQKAFRTLTPGTVPTLTGILEELTPPLSKQFTALVELAEAQNRRIGLRDTLQEQVYLYWYLDTIAYYDPFAAYRSNINYSEKLAEGLARLKALEEDVKLHAEAFRQTKEQFIRTLPAGIKLEEQPEDRFWAPCDPVLLATNTGGLNSPAHLQKRSSGLPRPKTSHRTITDSSGPLPVQDLLSSLLPPLLEKARQYGPAEDSAPWSPLYLEWSAVYKAFSSSGGMAPLQNWNLEGLDLKPLEKPEAEALTLTGRIALSPHAPAQLSESLKSLAARRGSRQAHALLRTAESAQELDILSQQLSGFHEQLLTHLPGLILPPFDPDPGRTALAEEVAAAIGRHNATAPNPAFPLHAVRGGTVLYDRLRLVDSFGRVRELQLVPPSIPKRLQSSLVPGEMLAPPRLLQPARLRFRWLSRDSAPGACYVENDPLPGKEPVFGWLAPNPLDTSLLLYEPEGYLCGSLRSFRLPNGTFDILWEDAPGLTASLLTPELEQFISPLLQSSLSYDPLKELLACISHTPSAQISAGPEIMLTGRLFALAKCSLKLETYGLPPEHCSFREQPVTPISGRHFPVQIGDPGHSADGLCGYYEDTTTGYQHLYSAYTADGSQYCKVPSATLSCDGPPIILTLLLDPSASLHLLTGYLPVATFTLPPALVQRAQSRIQAVMWAAPLLSSAQSLKLPLTVPKGSRWQWQERDSPASWQPPQLPEPASQNAWESLSPLQLREGWLCLEPVE